MIAHYLRSPDEWKQFIKVFHFGNHFEKKKFALYLKIKIKTLYLDTFAMRFHEKKIPYLIETRVILNRTRKISSQLPSKWLHITFGVRMSESNSTKSCCISSSSSWPTPDSSESSWWLRGVLTRFPDPMPTVLFEDDELPLRSWCKDGPEFESLTLLLFGPPLVLLFELPIPLEPLPELGLRKLVLSRNTS